MTALRYIWFAIALLLYPLRLALFLIHSTALFFTRTGGSVAVPAALVALGWWHRGNPIVEALIEAIGGLPVAFFKGAQIREAELFFQEWRGVVAGIVLFFLLHLALAITGAIVRPLLYALPAPRRPFLPRPPLYIPKHIIKTVRAREAVKPLGKPRYRGDMASLVPLLPPNVQAVLALKPPVEPMPAVLPPRAEAPAPAKPAAPVPPADTDIFREPARPASVKPAAPGEAPVPRRRQAPIAAPPDPGAPEPEPERLPS